MRRAWSCSRTTSRRCRSNKDARVHLCGLRADNMGVQCGGWSVGWRGRRGDITPGTTIRKAHRKGASAPASIDYSEDAAGAEKADVVVAVVGEDPYAEGSGDRHQARASAPRTWRSSTPPSAAASRSWSCCSRDGRSILGDVLDSASAVVAAWLPGTEGDGVADVLYGGVQTDG